MPLNLLILLISVAFFAGCSAKREMHYTASASYGCSSTDYKDSRFSGSTDDGCGYKLVGRVGGGVRQPVLDRPVKGEPVNAGNRPADLVEAEFGYVRHGDMDFNGVWLGTPDRGTIEADGYVLGLAYTRRMGDRLDLFAGGGAHRWEVKEREVFGGVPERRSTSGTSPYLGLGARYWVDPHFALRASWERYLNVGDRDKTGQGDIDNWWLGLDYLF